MWWQKYEKSLIMESEKEKKNNKHAMRIHHFASFVATFAATKLQCK